MMPRQGFAAIHQKLLRNCMSEIMLEKVIQASVGVALDSVPETVKSLSRLNIRFHTYMQGQNNHLVGPKQTTLWDPS